MTNLLEEKLRQKWNARQQEVSARIDAFHFCCTGHKMEVAVQFNRITIGVATKHMALKRGECTFTEFQDVVQDALKELDDMLDCFALEEAQSRHEAPRHTQGWAEA